MAYIPRHDTGIRQCYKRVQNNYELTKEQTGINSCIEVSNQMLNTTETWSSRSKAHIQSHLGGDLSIDQIAQFLYVGSTRLSVAFKRQTGTTLARYIREQRMDRARHLLSPTGENIAWIDRQVGYMRTSSFSTAITRETEVAPIVWREQSNRVR